MEQKAEAFAYDSEVRIEISEEEMTKFAPGIEGSKSFSIPYSLTEACSEPLLEEDLFDSLKIFNLFQKKVNKITIRRDEATSMVILVFRLRLNQLRFKRKKINFITSFCNKFFKTPRKIEDGLGDHRIVVGLFNLFSNEKIESINDMRKSTCQDKPPNDVNAIVDVLILFTVWSLVLIKD